MNDWTTPWTYRDVVEVVEGAGANLDCIMLPKVQTAEQVVALDLLLTQIERTVGLEVGRIGIEAQIENAPRADRRRRDRDGQSPRVETIIFGPADFMASHQHEDAWSWASSRPGTTSATPTTTSSCRSCMAARANGKQAIDGPYLQIRDVDGFRRVAGRSAALGFDGKWVLHPGQVDAAQRGLQPAPGGLRPRGGHPRRLRLVHLGGRRRDAARRCSATR